MYLIIYVDNLIITRSNTAIVDDFIANLTKKFSMKHLVLLSYFLGIKVILNDKGLILSQ